jgi:uncharacterized protein YktB (UPF0637 family)
MDRATDVLDAAYENEISRLFGVMVASYKDAASAKAIEETIKQIDDALDQFRIGVQHAKAARAAIHKLKVQGLI